MKTKRINKYSFSFIGALLALVMSLPSQAGIPGMRGSQHLGFTVPNAQEAVDFFVDVIGCEAFYTIGPFGPFDDDWMTENLNVHKKAVIDIAHLVRCGNGVSLEIFEYTSPDQNTTGPKNSDIGGHHLAFYVDDMDAAVSYLESKGVKILAKPHTFTDTGMEGLTWVYFMAPWGMQLEIVSYPYGQGYEKTTKNRMWDPRY
ncbi:VOC family protein [Enterovibrio sp. ZSDZ35]|uniref:VOC family protein n=1 Tax=Enterovibrio qingdaonensis TaxID=2899818 RepID=A0ABT5QH57_9GAMM|nr:VOC family protein [Enterovibrio sp. ZSDZ35]MDD1780292.1 VOC family protein [Enterovibrio sp. ZSDZ35]